MRKVEEGRGREKERAIEEREGEGGRWREGREITNSSDNFMIKQRRFKELL